MEGENKIEDLQIAIYTAINQSFSTPSCPHTSVGSQNSPNNHVSKTKILMESQDFPEIFSLFRSLQKTSIYKK